MKHWYFDGAISDVEIYDRALSDEEIEERWEGYTNSVKQEWWEKAHEHFFWEWRLE